MPAGNGGLEGTGGSPTSNQDEAGEPEQEPADVGWSSDVTHPAFPHLKTIEEH